MTDINNLPGYQELFETDLLRTFCYLAERKSFTKTAEALHITQSAVSHKIRKLEEGIRQQLFVRDGKEIRLTRSGEQLNIYARKIMALQRQAIDNLLLGDRLQEVRIGMPVVYWKYLLAKVPTDFFEGHGFLVNLSCASSTTLYDMYAQHQLDLCLMIHHDNATGGEIIGEEPLHWVGAPAGKSFQKRPLPLVVFQDDCIYRQKILTHLEQAGLDWQIVFISQDTSAVRETLTHDYGISLLGERTIGDELEAIDSEYLPKVSPAQMELCYRQEEAVSEVAELIRSVF